MISLIISLFASMSHTVTTMFQGNKNPDANKTVVTTKFVASKPNKSTYTKANNNPITVIKPGTLAAVSTKESNATSSVAADSSKNSSKNKINASNAAEEETPNDLSQYDDYARNINDLKRQIELNKLKTEVYKSSIDYEDPGSYDQATMIGVVVDPHGFKSAHIKLADDTTTDLMIGSRFGGYIVSDININAITLINAKCKKHRKAHKYKTRNHHRQLSGQSSSSEDIVIHTDTEGNKNNLVEENPLICRPVKIYPLYRDLNNRLPVGNSSGRTIGPASTGGARVYNGVPSTTNAMLNAAGAPGSGGTTISSGGMSLTIPPIETGSHGN